ncbi:MAG: ribosome maturation factor RimP [Oscillospiraceae bacterium]|jgi:ribosome maturation factor RimP|nr:ribosome maturation factor RimP [Oscillospiraceae bacterium]
MSKKIADIVSELALPILKERGLELWDAEFVREAGNYFLRVYIDAPKDVGTGVGIDDCEAVSRALDPLLDERESIFPDEGYTFEVSSAGLERSLRRPSDFERFLGSLVEVKLYGARNGKREYVGLLSGYGGGDVTLDVGGETEKFTKSEIANVKLRLS